jgi:hypothetical protein
VFAQHGFHLGSQGLYVRARVDAPPVFSSPGHEQADPLIEDSVGRRGGVVTRVWVTPQATHLDRGHTEVERELLGPNSFAGRRRGQRRVPGVEGNGD